MNPAHLWLGTKGDNNRDRESKGRGAQPSGERSNLAKLTARQVLEIRRLRAETKLSCAAIGTMFGVKWGAVQAIDRGRNWKQLRDAEVSRG